MSTRRGKQHPPSKQGGQNVPLSARRERSPRKRPEDGVEISGALRILPGLPFFAASPGNGLPCLRGRPPSGRRKAFGAPPRLPACVSCCPRRKMPNTGFFSGFFFCFLFLFEVDRLRAMTYNYNATCVKQPVRRGRRRNAGRGKHDLWRKSACGQARSGVQPA